MSGPLVDLRSDTITRPTAAMREAMARAEVGDDVFGEDPTVNALEEEVATILGKEAAMFTPSGTMANQIALQLHARPGDSVLIEEGAHLFVNEAGAGAALAGLQFDAVPLADGWSDEAILRRVRPEGLHAAPTTLLAVENTHNRALGRALPAAECGRIARTGRAAGLRLHCDGARLWNAAVALGVPEPELAEPFDTVAVCFSKGLGAPVGSALAGPRDLVGRARKLRKRLGGGMRQAGVLAAAARHALVRHRARLADDHRRARRLFEGITAAGGILRAEIAEPATNMVYVQAGDAADRVVAELFRAGVLVIHLGHGWIRAVTNLDVDDAGIDRAIGAFATCAR